MQYKEQGSKVHVLRYKSYDKVKKRSVVEMIGTIDIATLAPSDGLIGKLSDGEKEELQAEISRRRQAAEKSNRQYCAETVASRMVLAADCLAAGEYAIPSEQAAAIWTAMAKLGKALRKSGNPKPAATKRPKVDPGQTKQAEQAEAEGMPPKMPHTPLAGISITAETKATP